MLHYLRTTYPQGYTLRISLLKQVLDPNRTTGAGKSHMETNSRNSQPVVRSTIFPARKIKILGSPILTRDRPSRDEEKGRERVLNRWT